MKWCVKIHETTRLKRIQRKIMAMHGHYENWSKTSGAERIGEGDSLRIPPSCTPHYPKVAHPTTLHTPLGCTPHQVAHPARLHAPPSYTPYQVAHSTMVAHPALVAHPTRLHTPPGQGSKLALVRQECACQDAMRPHVRQKCACQGCSCAKVR